MFAMPPYQKAVRVAILLLSMVISVARLGAEPAEAAANLKLTLGEWHSTFAAAGGVPNARRYLLRVNGPPRELVTIREAGLPPHWVASFCTSRICAPYRLSFA